MANIPKGEIKWTASAGSTTGYTQKPTAKYSAISDGLRQITPETWKCSMFCGGKNCKYCNVPRGNWPTERMAIDGLFSEWVTDDILATSRPSTNAVKNIIEEFKKCGINSIINLQRPGEHASCGSPLEEESGFSYLPKDFMDENIFFYNFGWDDYGIRSLPSILDMVKVMSFALQEGKTAVHCHAGLGRTGVLIACYLIFSKRMDADQAIHFVREKRPGAIQTRGQIECCQQFGQFLIPLRVVFYSIDTRAYPFTLNQYLIRQKHMLHGYEARELKNIPKIIHVVCKRLTQLANCDFGIMNELNLSYERKMQIEKETAGKAFPEVRKKIPFEQSVSEGNTKVGVLPPIRRAKSEENILAECNEVNGQSSGTLNVPKATLSPGSPNLRFRSPNSDLDMKGTSGSSSSDDDLLTQKLTIPSKS
uniref:Protein tyrosine phosphatase domain-containing protein 1-like n=1 Tax=Saccoglossus kowalevskii TaxID=10224 RepID=A0ABM0MJU7_SACKO|nr:PREDICTED: protein tyrosine phosphatase domain-containing protein 1-like [Saccoglossus kowalevskii]